jgi:signal transduction histidine kinase
MTSPASNHQPTESWWSQIAQRNAMYESMYVVLVGLSIASAWLSADISGAPKAKTVAWTLAVVVPLALTKRWPLTGAIVVVGLFTIHRWIDTQEAAATSIAIFVAVAVAGANGGPRRNQVRAVCLALVVALTIHTFTSTETSPEFKTRLVLALGTVIVFNLFLFMAAWMLGDQWHERRRHSQQLELANEALAIARDSEAHRAVFAERVRIARELHDVVAHHVSVMGIQAGAARRVLERSPTDAAAALAVIEESSRQAVSELYQVLGLLRHEGAVETSRPQPSLSDLDELVAVVSDGGLAVNVQRRGVQRPFGHRAHRLSNCSRSIDQHDKACLRSPRRCHGCFRGRGPHHSGGRRRNGSIMGIGRLVWSTRLRTRFGRHA